MIQDDPSEQQREGKREECVGERKLEREECAGGKVGERGDQRLRRRKLEG